MAKYKSNSDYIIDVVVDSNADYKDQKRSETDKVSYQEYIELEWFKYHKKPTAWDLAARRKKY
jgi:hypothetical protein